MPFNCPVCGKHAPGSIFDNQSEINLNAYLQKFCSKPCSKKVKKLCRRVGCTETWYATKKSKKKYCSKVCVHSDPKFPYKVSRRCNFCNRGFITTIDNQWDIINKKKKVCNHRSCASTTMVGFRKRLMLIEEFNIPLSVARYIPTDELSEYIELLGGEAV